MNTSETERNPVEVLAEEFIERIRRGEKPTIEEYLEQHPELKDNILELFPAIAAMENLRLQKEGTSSGQASPGFTKVEQLGDFRIIGEIGRGGMGIVYEAEQISLNRRVAVKVLPKQTLLEEKKLLRFAREARTAARLHHTNIVPVFGVGEEDGLHYYVMQFIRGVGLDAVIEALRQIQQAGSVPKNGNGDGRRKRKQMDSSITFTPRQAACALQSGIFPHVLKSSSSDPGNSAVTNIAAQSQKSSGDFPRNPETEVFHVKPATQEQKEGVSSLGLFANSLSAHFHKTYWKSVARLGIQVADALDYAHSQNILHRDIKPSNLLLDAVGTLWVADFGLAKALEQDELSNSGDIVGTLQYMAPEQFQGKYDSRSDICSLGLTLYELLTLQPAYQDSNRSRLIHKIIQEEPPRPRKINREIPHDLETIVLKASSRDPAHRYQTAKDLHDDLEAFLEDRPIRARRFSYAERLSRWVRRNPAIASLTALAFSLLLLVAIVAMVGYMQTRDALEGETKQREIAEKALGGEAKQRKKAEATSGLALEVLEQIFEKLAPDQIVAASQLTFESSGGEQFEVSLPPTLSGETAALLEKMVPFYDRLAKQENDDPKVLRQGAKANRRLGDIYSHLGQVDQALKTYQDTAAMYEKLTKQFPGDALLTAEMASVYNALGQVFGKSKEIDKARQTHLKAIDVLTKPALSVDPPVRISYELARTYFHLGKMSLEFWGFHGPKQPGGAKGPPGTKQPDGPPKGPPPPKEIDGSSKVPPAPKEFDGQPKGKPGAKPPEVPPNGPPGAKQPGGSSTWTARKKEAEEYLSKAVEILKVLVQDQPAVPAYRHLLALCYREKSKLSIGLLARIDSEDRQEARELLEELVQQFPNVPDYRFDLSETLALMDLRGQFFPNLPESLEKDFQDALTLSKKLVAENPNVPDYQISKSLIHQRLAFVQKQNKELDKAEKNLRLALQDQNSLVQRFPKVFFHQFGKARIQDSLADILLEQKKWDECRQMLESSNVILEKLATQEERMKFLNYALVDNYQKLARAYREMGQAEPAAFAEQRATDFRQFLKGNFGFPKNPGKGGKTKGEKGGE